MKKDLWLEIAEAIDTFRVFPRTLICGYAFYVYKVTFFILDWYAHQPKEARGLEESAVVGVVVTAVTGFAPWLFKIYSDGGRDWSPPATTSSTVIATKTTKVES